MGFSVSLGPSHSSGIMFGFEMFVAFRSTESENLEKKYKKLINYEFMDIFL